MSIFTGSEWLVYNDINTNRFLWGFLDKTNAIFGDQRKTCLTKAQFRSFWNTQPQNLNHPTHIFIYIKWVMAGKFKVFHFLRNRMK